VLLNGFKILVSIEKAVPHHILSNVLLLRKKKWYREWFRGRGSS